MKGFNFVMPAALSLPRQPVSLQYFEAFWTAAVAAKMIFGAPA
jgi:hypothetical protein